MADTEDDKPEILDRTVFGNTETYQNRCLQSVNMIQSTLDEYPKITTSTFTQEFPDFRSKQYNYEALIREHANRNQTFHNKLTAISDKRSNRHNTILGREECDMELTVRYIAQYAALGDIMRNMDGLVSCINYPTPNRKYFNIGLQEQIQLPDSKDIVIPILGSVLS